MLGRQTKAVFIKGRQSLAAGIILGTQHRDLDGNSIGLASVTVLAWLE
jgi:hypothetical protein